MSSSSQPQKEQRKTSDRRHGQRYDTSMPVEIRLAPDGSAISGFATEMGPNGMRMITTIPLVESSYVHISFQGASNNTHCEGRVVWTEPRSEQNEYESGVDIQRWGGGMPGNEGVEHGVAMTPKKDRRKKPR